MVTPAPTPTPVLTLNLTSSLIRLRKKLLNSGSCTSLPPIGKPMFPDRETVSYIGTTKLTIFEWAESDAFGYVLTAIIGVLVEK